MKFLINTITNWTEPPRARHFVTYTLSKRYKVVFIAANRFGFPSLKLNRVHENLTVITPIFPVDMRIRYRIPVINEIYQTWLFCKIVKKYKDFEVINFDYTATRIFKYFNNVIYYCNDSYAEISKKINPALVAKYHELCEAKIAAKSKFCVAISYLIKKNIQQYNPNVVEIPLGSPDIDDYNISIRESPSKNKLIEVVLVAVIKKLNISHRVINLLLEDDSINLTLIGPIEDGFLKHIKNKNRLMVKGPMLGRELYEEINKFDVAIAPYCTKSTNEIFSGTGGKIYHYLSVGKPVVISYMSGLTQLNLQDKLIYVAKEEEEFPILVHKAFNENSTELIYKRIGYAKCNTWDKRMEDLISYYKTNNQK